MKQISLWAKKHPWSARFIIISGFGILTVAGIITGMLLNDLTVILPSAASGLLIIFFFAVLLLYPSTFEKRRSTAALFYKKKKTCDSILVAVTFLMIICISNDQFRNLQYFPRLDAATSKPGLPAGSTLKNYKSLFTFSASLKDKNGKSLKWKEKRKLLKEQIRAIKKSDDLSDGAKIALIVLSVVVALGLLYLIAALACSLSCSGSEFAAILLGVGGAALIVFLLVLVIKAITGKKKKKAILKEKPVMTG